MPSPKDLFGTDLGANSPFNPDYHYHYHFHYHDPVPSWSSGVGNKDGGSLPPAEVEVYPPRRLLGADTFWDNEEPWDWRSSKEAPSLSPSDPPSAGHSRADPPGPMVRKCPLTCPLMRTPARRVVKLRTHCLAKPGLCLRVLTRWLHLRPRRAPVLVARTLN